MTIYLSIDILWHEIELCLHEDTSGTITHNNYAESIILMPLSL